MCAEKEIGKTKVDELIAALNANTVAVTSANKVTYVGIDLASRFAEGAMGADEVHALEETRS